MFKTSSKRIVFPVLIYSLVSFAIILTSGNSKSFTLSTVEETGLQVYQKKNCMTCHSMYGLGGHIGPDLTNVASRNDEQYVKNTILFGRGKMPSFDLGEEELRQLLDFLRRIDESTIYPVKSSNDIFGELKNEGSR